MPEHRAVTLSLTAYAAFGIVWGSWQVLLVDLAGALALSEGPLGAALTIGFAISLPVMVLAGRAADATGARWVTIISGMGLAVGLAAFAAVPTYLLFVLACAALLSASGAFDVGINATAIALEQRTRVRFLPIMHAAFSAGGVAGALGAGWLVVTGLEFRLGYLGAATLMAIAALAWLSRDADVPARPPTAARADRSLYRSRPLLVLATLTAIGFMGEGAMETWTAIYLRASLDATPLLGATGLAVFHLAMLVGRLLTATASRRLGRVVTLRGAGALVAVAMLAALATEMPLIVIGGLLFVGLGLAAIAPIAFSLAGDAAPSRAGQASAVLTTIGYGGFLMGPGIVGGVAEVTSLRLALGVVALTGLAVAALASGVRRSASG